MSEIRDSDSALRPELINDPCDPIKTTRRNLGSIGSNEEKNAVNQNNQLHSPDMPNAYRL